jgi:hypothetical protein
MAKIRNTSGENRIVPSLGGRLVLADVVVDVPDEDVYAYTCQEGVWAPTDEAAEAAHTAATAAPELDSEDPEPILNPDDPTEG